MRKQRVYGGSRGYRSAREIVVCARMLVRGLPSGRHIGCKALRLKSALTQATDAQNGDHTQLIRALAPAAQRRQPRTGSTPHLGRGQQQHATAATS